jgi:hypothetical protein
VQQRPGDPAQSGQHVAVYPRAACRHRKGDRCARGQFQPFTPAELTAKYGSKEKYLELYQQSLAKLIEQGFVLPEDEIAMLGYASYLWDNAESYIERSRSASTQ